MRHVQTWAHALAPHANTLGAPENTLAPLIAQPPCQDDMEGHSFLSARGSSELSSPCISSIGLHTNGIEWRSKRERHLKVTLLEFPRQAPPATLAPPPEAITDGALPVPGATHASRAGVMSDKC